MARLLRPPYRVDALDLRASVDDGVLDLQPLDGPRLGRRASTPAAAPTPPTSRLALRLRADDVDLRAMLADTTGYDGLRGRGAHRRRPAQPRRHGRCAARRARRAGCAGAAAGRDARRRPDADAARLAHASTTGSDVAASDAVRQTDFSLLAASFELRDGVAQSSDLDGESEFLRVSGEGSIDLAQGRLDYLLRTRVVNTASGRAGPEMVFLNGVTVPVRAARSFRQHRVAGGLGRSHRRRWRRCRCRTWCAARSAAWRAGPPGWCAARPGCCAAQASALTPGTRTAPIIAPWTTPVALLTAAGSGIGAAAARKLAAEGWQVAILSSSGRGEALAAELGGLGVTGSNQRTERPAAPGGRRAGSAGAASTRWSTAPAIGPKGELLEISDADWQRGMEFYLLNVVRIARLVTPLMQQQKRGAIVNV